MGKVLMIGIGGPGSVGRSGTVVARARWSVFKIAYMAAFPLLLFLGALLEVDNLNVSGRHLDVLANAVVVLAVVLMLIPGQVLRQWVEETDRRDDYLMAGPFLSAFADYSLRLAGWEWPWFNRVRTSVLILGLACWAVVLSGSVLFGWS